MPLLTGSQLKLSYGDLQVFSNVSLEISSRARIGMVGSNGAGKTSLIKILVGELEPDGGVLEFSSGLSIGYVSQIPKQEKESVLRDQLMAAFSGLKRLENLLAVTGLKIQQSSPDQRPQVERNYSEILLQYEAEGGYDYESFLERVATGVGLAGDTLDTPAHLASGGERTRASLARALLEDPDLLILDEPTNYLDFKGLDWLETFLRRTSKAFIVVSHDRYFLDQVADQIWALDQGELKNYKGNFSKYRTLKENQIENRKREFKAQQDHIAKEQEFIRRYGAGQRAREARGRATKLARLVRVVPVFQEKAIGVKETRISRTGETVISTSNLVVGYREREQQIELLTVPDLTLYRGSKIAIIGSNGVGKTTLLDVLTGLVRPLTGYVKTGYNVDIGYQRQHIEDLPLNSNVLETLLDIRNIGLTEARNYLARFMFQGEDAFQPVSSLSGGERARLGLARLLLKTPNTLVLDEPTTHLDISSRERLEQVLKTYEGTLLFVSHDRHLISLLANQLWIIEHGSLTVFEGTYQDWTRSIKDALESLNRGSKDSKKNKQSLNKKRVNGKKKHSAHSPEPNLEQLISDLESRMNEIEKALALASEKQDVPEITRLGEEYNNTQSRLEQALGKWMGV